MFSSCQRYQHGALPCVCPPPPTPPLALLVGPPPPNPLLTLCQFWTGSFTFCTEPGCSLLMSLRVGVRGHGKAVPHESDLRVGGRRHGVGGGGLGLGSYSQRMTPSLRPSMKLSPMRRPVAPSIHTRS